MSGEWREITCRASSDLLRHRNLVLLSHMHDRKSDEIARVWGTTDRVQVMREHFWQEIDGKHCLHLAVSES